MHLCTLYKNILQAHTCKPLELIPNSVGVLHLLQILDKSRAVICLYASPGLHCTISVYKLQARSMMLHDVL